MVASPSSPLKLYSHEYTNVREVGGKVYGRRANAEHLILVCGATGNQGGAVAQSLSPGRVAARVRLNRPDLRRSCITVRSTSARLSTAPMRLASSLGCTSISPPAPEGRRIIAKYNSCVTNWVVACP